jgi:hypothetical protein
MVKQFVCTYDEDGYEYVPMMRMMVTMMYDVGKVNVQLCRHMTENG